MASDNKSLYMWLVILAVVAAVVGLVYYLKKRDYASPPFNPEEDMPDRPEQPEQNPDEQQSGDQAMMYRADPQLPPVEPLYKNKMIMLAILAVIVAVIALVYYCMKEKKRDY